MKYIEKGKYSISSYEEEEVRDWCQRGMKVGETLRFCLTVRTINRTVKNEDIVPSYLCSKVTSE